MTVYIGVDFHPFEQSVAFCSEEDGEIGYKRFLHSDKQSIKAFYRKCGADAVIGVEATGCLAATRRSASSIYRLAAGEAAPKQKWQRPGSSSLTVTSCYVTESVTRNSPGGAKLACARGLESWAETPQSLEA